MKMIGQIKKDCKKTQEKTEQQQILRQKKKANIIISRRMT